MTTRRQILLAIVPVFAALALVGNGVTYYFLSRAALDGLRGEAGTFAVSFSAFKHPGDWQRLEDGQSGDTVYPAALAKLDRWEILRGFAIWKAADLRPVYRYPDTATLASPPADALARFNAHEPFVTSALAATGEKAALTGYAPLFDNSGNIAGIVGAEIDASLYPHEIDVIRQRLVRTTLLIVLLGVIVALLLASLISRELRHLAVAAGGIEHGRYVPPPTGLIAEVADLSQTLGVLEGVIEEIRAKSHRAFAENEQFRTEEDLVAAYRETFLTPLSLRAAGLDVAVAVTPDAVDVFREAAAGANDARVIFGRIKGSATLETATLASAAGRELDDRLARGETPASALTATAALFPLQSATVLTWQTGAAHIDRADLAEGKLAAATLAMPPPGELLIAHGVSAAAADAIEIYLARFRESSVAERVADVIKLASGGNGVIAVLSR